jgi:recombination protein RecT
MATQKGLIQKATKTNKESNALARPIDKLKHILAAQSVQEQFQSVLKENAGAFVASIIDLYNTDRTLQMCDPKNVVMEALKAASLKLPINKQLGFAWIVPYRDGKTGQYIPTFQLGYKGYIQLCMRTGAYRYINADVVYEGELVKQDKLTGEIEIDPSKRTSDKKIGYFAFIETLNGFRKTLYMTVEEVTKHAKQYSKSYGRENSVWATDFDAMALKTCLRLLLSKYGVMSVEMQRAYIDDGADTVTLADEKIADDTFDGEVIEAEAVAVTDIPEDATEN